jgi:hypothetical protein
LRGRDNEQRSIGEWSFLPSVISFRLAVALLALLHLMGRRSERVEGKQWNGIGRIANDY